MVWDTATDDKVFHSTEDKARKDYNEAVSMIKDERSVGEFTVYLFELKEQEVIETPHEDC